MKRRSYLAPAALGALAAAVILGAWGLSLRRSVTNAVDEARAGRARSEVKPELIFEGEWTTPPNPRSQTLTRLLPLYDAAPWNNGIVLAGDGGLLIPTPAGPRLLTAADGLPATRITSLAVFHDLIIAGADRGLAVLDRQHLKSYRFPAPAMDRITCLLALPDAVLIGTQGAGLIAYDGAAFFRPPVYADLPDLRVTALADGPSGPALATWDDGVYLLDSGARRHLTEADGLIYPVLSLYNDGPRTLIGDPQSLLAREPGRGISTVAPDVFAASVARDQSSILVAGLDQGVLLVQADTARWVESDYPARKLIPTPAGLLIAGDRGLRTYSSGRFGPAAVTLPAATDRLAENRLTAVLPDRAGRLWLGTFEHGVDVLEPNLDLAAHLEVPGHEAVNCIRAGTDGGLIYVGTGRGVLVYAGTRLVRTITTETGLIGESVSDVLVLPGARLVFATNKGVTFEGPAGMQSLYTFHGLVNNHVYALARLGDRIAAGTLGGLSLIQDHRVVESYTMDNSDLPHNWITALQEAGGRLYIGTFGGGVVALTETGQWVRFDRRGAPAEVNQNALAWVGDEMFAGGFTEGLARLETATGQWRTASDRLVSNNVTGVALWPGPGGNRLALATDAGLSLISFNAD